MLLRKDCACTTLAVLAAMAACSGCLADDSPIVLENELQGTSEWATADSDVATDEIQAYASAASVSPGETLHVFVSTNVAGTPYSARVFRLGWYGGKGGRSLAVQRGVGQAQGVYNAANRTMVNCRSCTFDTATRRTDAHWQESLSFEVPASWRTGRYVIKLTDIANKQTYVPFIVRGKHAAPIVVVLPDNTTAAYNLWGGHNLYHGPDHQLASRAYAVSFDRPNLFWRVGAGHGLPYEVDAIHWLEREGYSVDYLSSIDLHQHPEWLLTYRAYISVGHDEYWSTEMRNGVEQMRNSGKGLAFFGANAAYWRVQFEPNDDRVPDRVMTCYKAAPNNADPARGMDPAQWTTRWRDAPLSRPENGLIGIAYVEWIEPRSGFPWVADPNAKSALLANTGIVPGTSYGCNYVGYEWDAVLNNGATPNNLHILGTSPAIAESGTSSTSNTTYYISGSGGLVFASGSINWAYALDDFRQLEQEDPTYPDFSQPDCLARSASAIPIQKLMKHIMAELTLTHANDLN